MQTDSATRHASGAFAWSLGTDTGSVGTARQAFVAWLRKATTNPELLQDMSVVVSELASNAVDGADPDRPEADVRAQIDDDVLEIVVSNRTPAVADVHRWDLEDTLRGGGRGLMIVRAYTDSLAVDSTGDIVSVRCTRRLDEAS